MSKFTALVYCAATLSSLCHVSLGMSQFAILNGRRCDNTERMLSPASDTRHVLSCIASCRATTDCNSVNFSPNAAAGSCETLQTSEQDSNELAPDNDWNFYSTNVDSLAGNVNPMVNTL